MEKIGHIDHCACFPRTQSQKTYLEEDILTIPYPQLMHAVVSFIQPLPTGEVSEGLGTLNSVRKQLNMSSNGSEIGTKHLVPANYGLFEAQYRSHNHCLKPPPNGQEQDDAETISDHPLDILRAA